jgi:hypothetical protein
MSSARQCDAIGCTTATASGKFMCWGHWQQVPAPLQDTIYSRYRALRKDARFLHDVAYLQACVTAIDNIATAEGKQGANPYRRLLAIAQRQQQEAQG